MQEKRYLNALLLLPLATGALLSACGPADPPATPYPEAPLAARQAPNAPDDAGADTPPPPPTVAPPVFTESLVSRIVRGMAREDVERLAGVVGEVIGGDGGDVIVVRYTDARGSAFTARFDGGQLRARSGLRAAPSTEPAPAQTFVAPPDTGGEAVAEIAPGVFIPLDRAVAASTGQPRGIDNTPRPTAPEPAAALAQPPATTSGPAPGPQIAIAGDARAASSSYQPRANLPPFTRSLHDGRHEVRLINPGNATIQAGLRQDKLGRDTTIPPGGQASFQVERGVYRLYYIRESEPYTLHETDPLTLDGFLAPNVEVRLDPANVETRLIDYSTPEQ